MSKRTAPRQQKDALGFKLCRMPECGKRIGKGMRSYCSRECRTQFAIAYFPSSARWHVYKRDKGVCAKCNLDTDRMQRILKWVADRCRNGFFGEFGNRWRFAAGISHSFGFDGSVYSDGGFWQADHVLECVNGGWGKGLENFRTLCTPCHKSETARLAGELAAARKPAPSSLFAEGEAA